MSGKIPRIVRRGEPANLAQLLADDLLADHATLADGPAAVEAVGAHTLTNHDGSVIKGVDLVLITLDGWNGDAERLEDFARDLVLGGYLDPLAPYGSGRGSSITSVAIAAPAAWQHGMTVTDATLQALVAMVIDNGHPSTPTTLYMVMCPDGVTVQFDTDPTHGASCTAFCGYHSAMQRAGGDVAYGIVCDTTCGGCNGGHAPFDAATMVLAHEIAEACSDTWPGRGWYEDSSGSENADLCAWQVVQYGPWIVQPFWTNESGPSAGVYEDHHTQNQPQPPPVTQPNTHPDVWAWLKVIADTPAYQFDAELAVVAQALRSWGF